jgi:acyl-CoA ligase (AMP-forming) (exosortase A-associated)
MIQSVAELLQRSASRWPDAVALVDGPRRQSYAEAARQAEDFGSGLVGLGLPRAARVAVFLDKSLEAVATFHGALGAGLIAVPINPKLKPAQVKHILRDSGAAALVTTPFRFQQLLEEIDASELPVILTGGAGTPAAPCRGPHGWDELVAAGQARRLAHRSIDIDAATILYTSGSTGLPKGVTVSHRNLVAGAGAVNRYLGTTADDRILSLLPLSFDAGLSQLTTAVAAGARLILHNYMRAQEVVGACRTHGVTSITSVPPLWAQITAVPWDEAAGAAVRIIANTGGHMPLPLLQKLRAVFPAARPFLMYGLTEAFRSTYLDPSEIDSRPGSIGKAIPNAEILVLDEAGRPCPPNSPGELVHRGALVTLGYWNAPELTAERFRPLETRPAAGLVAETAVWSGDIVRLDEDGFLYFVGRRDEMLKSSGYRISPTEIENVLHAAPGVKEAAAFGIRHESLGDIICAAVTAALPPLDVAAVEQFCNRMLPSYMVPRLYPLEELPRSPNGKIDRKLLPALCCAEDKTPVPA